MNTDPLADALDLVRELDEVTVKSQLEVQYADVAERCPGGPYKWQREFHDAGKLYSFRAIVAGNRTGKSRCAAAEIAMHLTGKYPRWWKGKRYERPIIAVVCGQTNEELRNIEQKALFGGIEQKGHQRKPDGTGWVPAEDIGASGFRQCGVPNVLDTVKVKHVNGGWSEVMLKSYEQGPLKFQGFECDIMWFDEEPEDDAIFTEAITRLISRKGIFMFTRTPLFGNSDIVLRFLRDDSGQTWYTTATWDDAPHLDKDEKEKMLALYPEHERDARTKGIPMMGSGGVYPVNQSEIICPWFEIPDWFLRIVGVDFGMDHPFAAVWLAYDPDADIVYVTDTHKQKNEIAAYHADAIKSRGQWIPVSWPHDGFKRDPNSGKPIADLFREKGVNMLHMSARYDNDKGGGQATEPAVQEILGRMRTGRFKVINTPANELWFEEQRMYHRKESGTPPIPQIVKIKDDVMSATNYAYMMLRFAESKSAQGRPVQIIAEAYDPLEDWN